MIRLHERLSEFSFGYGVTDETRQLLGSVGWQSAPFLPSLIHEKEVGFDVAFSKPGAVLMLQFKLGDELRRFHRTTPAQSIPDLDRPFWRFRVDTGEHQFNRLWSFEVLGAEVYYVAPRFSDWAKYENLFQAGKVLESCLLITPVEIRNAIAGAAGEHRIVYDRTRRYVCSEPTQTPDISAQQLVQRIASRAQQPEPLANTIKRLAYGDTADTVLERLPERQRDQLRAKARTPVEGDAAVVAMEAWLQGAQTIFIGAPAEEPLPPVAPP